MSVRGYQFLVLAALPLVLGACRNQSDAGEELSYIRMSGSDYAPSVSSENLLPLRTGAKWEMRVRTERGELLATEVQRVVGVAAGVGTIETSRDGKLVQVESFRVSPQKIEMTGTGTSHPLPLNPPVTLLSLPVDEEQVVSWQGTAGSGNETFTGQAFSRATRREKVETPAGALAAWRVDTRSELSLGGQRELVHISRWFAPGIGIVRQRVAMQKFIVIKELKKLPDIETGGVK